MAKTKTSKVTQKNKLLHYLPYCTTERSRIPKTGKAMQEVF
jgi:hypothetical protein